MTELSRLIRKAHQYYSKYHEEIEQELTDDEFMALYEQMPEFDEYDDTFVEHEEAWTEDVARYIDDHIDRFAQVVND